MLTPTDLASQSQLTSSQLAPPAWSPHPTRIIMWRAAPRVNTDKWGPCSVFKLRSNLATCDHQRWRVLLISIKTNNPASNHLEEISQVSSLSSVYLHTSQSTLLRENNKQSFLKTDIKGNLPCPGYNIYTILFTIYIATLYSEYSDSDCVTSLLIIRYYTFKTSFISVYLR